MNSAAEPALTVAALLQRHALLATVSDTPRLDAELMLAALLDWPRSRFYARPDAPVTAVLAQDFEAMLARRAAGEPLAYILGRWEFWSLPLHVTPASIVPRPETERLVEVALEHMPAGAGRALDLGTGCGAIALALASERRGWSLLGVDRNPEAVALSAVNAGELALENARFVHGDWFTGLAESEPFDLIVANPPYIAPDDAHLADPALGFEPAAALVAADAGLAAVRAIIAAAPQHLRTGGWLLLEHGYDQGAAVRALLGKAGFDDIDTWPDHGGRDRVSGGRRPA